MTAQEATATRVRVEELRELAADDHRQLSMLPPPSEQPLAGALKTYRDADADIETAEAKLRRAQAIDVSVRFGIDSFTDRDTPSPYFAVVQVGLNLGILFQGSANARAAAGRQRLVQSGRGPGVEGTVDRLRTTLEIETKRARETAALVTELARQLEALDRIGGDDSKRYQPDGLVRVGEGQGPARVPRDPRRDHPRGPRRRRRNHRWPAGTDPMTAARWLVLAAMAGGGCGSSRSEAAPSNHTPSIDVAPVASAALCTTRGALDKAGSVAEPTFRGYAPGAGGEAAQLTFTYRGESNDTRELANGQARRQIGLKLRAQDSCNVVYVMWRLDPKPKIDVSVKFNANMHTHADCGADGYTKIRPYKKTLVPAFEYGKTHTLRAEIVGDELFAWVDGQLQFQGRLPDAARVISGPAGLRSDNVKFDLVELAAPHREGTPPACKRENGD